MRGRAAPQPDRVLAAVVPLMIVKCVVSTQGVVRNCRVMKSLPFMDRAVIEALEKRRYTPALLRGQPIEVDYTFKIKLTLPR